MAYANSVGITYLHPPEPEPQRNAFLWRLWTTFDPNHPSTPPTPHEAWVEQAELSGVSGGTFSFNLGPALTDGQFALSIQEAGWDGPLFRSGLFETLPTPAPADPAGGVDIFVPDPIDIEKTVVQSVFENDSFVRDHNLGPAASLPREPSITHMEIELGQNQLTITATYQAIEIPPTRYTRTFAFKPSSEVRFSRQLFEIEEPSPPSGTNAADAHRTIGLAIIGVQNALEGTVENKAIAAMAQFTVPAPATVPAMLPTVTPPPTLPTPAPPIVSLSVRRVDITPTSIRVFPALGAFGSVTRKVFPGWPPQTTNKKCALTHSALLAFAALDLDLLRSFRDQLLMSQHGARLVDLYYQHGAEVARIVDADRPLARSIAAAVRDLQSTLRQRQQLPPSLLQRGRPLLRQIASRGTQELRRDVDAILRDLSFLALEP
jgi:hypothetical protein